MPGNAGGTGGSSGRRTTRRFSFFTQSEERGVQISGPIGPVFHNGTLMGGDRLRNSTYVGRSPEIPTSEQEEDVAPSEGSLSTIRPATIKPKSSFLRFGRKASTNQGPEAQDDDDDEAPPLRTIIPDPSPVENQYITKAMPSEYWSGRFSALNDKFHSELLQVQDMGLVLRSHPVPVTGSSPYAANNPSTSVYGSTRSTFPQSGIPSSATAGAILQPASATEYKSPTTSVTRTYSTGVPPRKPVGSGIRPKPSTEAIMKEAGLPKRATVEDEDELYDDVDEKNLRPLPIPPVPTREALCPPPQEMATLLPAPLFSRAPNPRAVVNIIPSTPEKEVINQGPGLLPAPVFVSRIPTSTRNANRRPVRTGNYASQREGLELHSVTSVQERTIALHEAMLKAETIRLSDQDARARRVFAKLQSLCTTDEARRSLTDWQQDYARRVGRHTLLPVGGTMEDPVDDVVTGIAKVGQFFRSGSAKLVDVTRPKRRVPTLEHQTAAMQLGNVLKEQRARGERERHLSQRASESQVVDNPTSDTTVPTTVVNFSEATLVGTRPPSRYNPYGIVPQAGTFRSMSSVAIGLGTAGSLDGIYEATEEDEEASDTASAIYVGPGQPFPSAPAPAEDPVVLEDNAAVRSESAMRNLRKKISQRFTRI